MSAKRTAPLTPDGRYILVRGRLWRATNPSLSPERRAVLVRALMTARRLLAQPCVSQATEQRARRAVQAIKQWLGERGPVWWTDGAPDLQRKMARTTSYAQWAAEVEQADAPSVK